ncbi:hypothetical protein DXG01_012608 [Tephrocybe rancida]|nr:hypothetical protein DXG01_012608 [Tephrocybe rancida]
MASIYATPSTILRSAGSVGNTFIFWTAGAFLASLGTIVIMEYGTGIPRSGGEKTYLKFLYGRPEFLAMCIFAAIELITKNLAANVLACGEYLVHALSLTPSRFNIHGMALLVLTFCFLVHGTTPTIGLRVQNALGLFKLFILWAISMTGTFCLLGIPGFSVDPHYEAPDNFAWDKFWEGSTQISPNSIVTGIFTVMWSFSGYTYVNVVLGEVRDPVQTVQRAAPLALLLVFMTYTAVNIGYFAVVAKGDVLNSGRLIAWV